MWRHPLILVAEDDHDTAQVISVALSTELSAHVRIVPNGRRLLEEVRRARPDLIVADIVMPEVDGIVAISTLAAAPATSGTPIVAISASPNSKAALAAGATVFVAKPIDLEHLVRTVRDLLTAASAR